MGFKDYLEEDILLKALFENALLSEHAYNVCRRNNLMSTTDLFKIYIKHLLKCSKLWFQLLPEDFKKHGLPYRDSLRWIDNFEQTLIRWFYRGYGFKISH